MSPHRNRDPIEIAAAEPDATCHCERLEPSSADRNASKIVPASSQWNSRSGRSQTLIPEDTAFALAGAMLAGVAISVIAVSFSF